MRINSEHIITIVCLYILVIGLYVVDIVSDSGKESFVLSYLENVKEFPLHNGDEYLKTKLDKTGLDNELVDKWIEVEILGAVKRPGVYRVISGTRLNSLVQKAGGLTKGSKVPIKNYYLKDGKTYYIKYN